MVVEPSRWEPLLQIKQIFLDANSWNDVLDFYKAIFAQIGAPDWHGESVAARLTDE